MSEQWVPPFELWKTDHGIDGWDAKTWLVAKFTTHAKAAAYLAEQGFTHQQHGAFYHRDPEHRHTMGAISYEIREARQEVPLDPSPAAVDR